jgi:hypothetical protein
VKPEIHETVMASGMLDGWLIMLAIQPVPEEKRTT